jgi:AraC family transcriptional regulator of adaptative response/methylated-DNA-[protein]-cysteine methyltransferase
MLLTDEIMYQALVEKDSSFEGIFFAGVKTTGIFCRPTCTARKPKKDNVEFFNSTADAIQHGYRPCRVCTPLENAGTTPGYITDLIREINEKPNLNILDSDLISRGIEPYTIRRWFKKNHGVTFHSYQRMQRINFAFKKIQDGETVDSVAFDTGYESLSGFGESYKSTTGFTPKESKEKRIINLTRIETPLGAMFAGATTEGVCILEFIDRKILEFEFQSLAKQMNAVIIHGDCEHFSILKKEIDLYFKGELREFTVPLFLIGTDFQKGVWNELIKIPFGKTRSYKQQSIALNNPAAIRAVAQANGKNMIAIIIPCHRVIGENGHLTGYGGGIWRKKWLLDHEMNLVGNVDFSGQQRLAFKL